MKELTVREIQFETLKNMKEIAKICEKNNLKYCLAYGTLIGAIRNNGFIPWDDDLDILMPRDDYEKFKKYCLENKNELKPFELFTPETHQNYPYMIGRFCNTDYELIPKNENPCGMGTFVDIYPLDGLGNDINVIRKKAKWMKLSQMFYALVSQKHFKRVEKKYLAFPKFLLSFIAKIIGKNFFYKRLVKYPNMFNYSESKYVGCTSWFDGGMECVFEKTDIENTILHKFEDTNFFIPANYDKLLSEIYGDYMKLPPESERIGHHLYKIYRKNGAEK